jgi:hypothetical protein
MMHQSVAHAQEEIVSLKAEVERLRATNAKLVAALKSVAFLATQTRPTENATWEDYAKTCFRIIADEANRAIAKAGGKE